MSDDGRPDLDAIEARAAAATPGPWEDATGSIWHSIWHDGARRVREFFVRRPGDNVAIAADVFDPIKEAISGANAAFIAHAREDVPALVAYVRRLESELASARAGLTQQALLLALPSTATVEREACAALCERMARELETVPMGPIRDAVARRDLAVSELRRAAGRIRAGERDGYREVMAIASKGCICPGAGEDPVRCYALRAQGFYIGKGVGPMAEFGQPDECGCGCHDAWEAGEDDDA